MLTTVQSYINELTGYQVPVEQRSLLAGKGPAMKSLAAKIKDLWPSLNQDDKALFVAALSRGRFAITPDIWNLFLDAVGSSAPASTPSPAAPASTNKVAGEILETCQVSKALLLDLVGMVSNLQKQIAELKRPAPRRGAKAKIEDSVELASV